MRIGDEVIVICPTAGLPAFNISGRVSKVQNIEKVMGEVLLVVSGQAGSWNADRFEKFKTRNL